MPSPTSTESSNHRPHDDKLHSDIATMHKLIFAAVITSCFAIPVHADENVVDRPKAPAEQRPTLDELMKKFAEHEARYSPFHITYRTTSRGADGKVHGLQVEEAQAEPLRWMRVESASVNREVTRDYKWICDIKGIHHFCKPGVCKPFAPHGESPFRFTTSMPLLGIFPLRMYWPSNGMLLSEYYNEDPSRVQLAWLGPNAALSFEFGPRESFRTRYVLWLSPKYDWHPVRMELYRNNEADFSEEWQATKFYRSTIGRQIRAGSFRARRQPGFDERDQRTRNERPRLGDRAQLNETGPVGSEEQRPAIGSSTDFVVENSTYGTEIDEAVFALTAPPNRVGEVLPNRSPQDDKLSDSSGATSDGVEESLGTIDDDQITSPPRVDEPASGWEKLRLQLVDGEIELLDLIDEHGDQHPSVVGFKKRLQILKEYLAKHDAGLSRAARQFPDAVGDFLRQALLNAEIHKSSLVEELGTEHPSVAKMSKQIAFIEGGLAEHVERIGELQLKAWFDGKSGKPNVAVEDDQTIRDATLTELLSELAKVESDLATQSKQYGEKHPSIQNLKQRAAALRAAVAAAGNETANEQNEAGQQRVTDPASGKPPAAEQDLLNMSRSSQRSKSFIPPADRKFAERQRDLFEVTFRESEQESLAAAAAYRAEAAQKLPDADALEDLQKQLQVAVRKSFEAQSRFQEARLHLAELDLQNVKAKLERRKTLGKQVIDRRIEDLKAGSDLSWQMTGSGAADPVPSSAVEQQATRASNDFNEQKSAARQDWKLSAQTIEQYKTALSGLRESYEKLNTGEFVMRGVYQVLDKGQWELETHAAFDRRKDLHIWRQQESGDAQNKYVYMRDEDKRFVWSSNAPVRRRNASGRARWFPLASAYARSRSECPPLELWTMSIPTTFTLDQPFDKIIAHLSETSPTTILHSVEIVDGLLRIFWQDRPTGSSTALWLDPEMGYVPVQFQRGQANIGDVKLGRMQHEAFTKWIQKSDAFVPVQWTAKEYGGNGEVQEIQRSYNLQLNWSSVNTPLAATTFDWQHAGLPKGTEVYGLHNELLGEVKAEAGADASIYSEGHGKSGALQQSANQPGFPTPLHLLDHLSEKVKAEDYLAVVRMLPEDEVLHEAGMLVVAAKTVGLARKAGATVDPVVATLENVADSQLLAEPPDDAERVLENTVPITTTMFSLSTRLNEFDKHRSDPAQRKRMRQIAGVLKDPAKLLAGLAHEFEDSILKKPFAAYGDPNWDIVMDGEDRCRVGNSNAQGRYATLDLKRTDNGWVIARFFADAPEVANAAIVMEGQAAARADRSKSTQPAADHTKLLADWLKQARALGVDAEEKRDKAVREIAKALNAEEHSLQIVAATALAQLGDVKFDKKEFRPRILELCRSKNAEVQRGAFYALLNNERQDGDLELLQEVMAEPVSGRLAESASHLLQSFDEGVIRGKSEEIVVRLLNSSDKSLRREALRGLWGAKYGEKITNRVIELVDNKESHHDAIYYALSTSPEKTPAAIDKLIEVLSDPDWNNWGRAIWGLGYGVPEDQQTKVAAAMLQMYELRSDPKTRGKCERLVRAYGDAKQIKELEALTGNSASAVTKPKEGAATTEPQPDQKDELPDEKVENQVIDESDS